MRRETRYMIWLAALYVVAMVALVAWATEPARPGRPASDSVSVPADTFYHMTPEQLRGTCDVTSSLECQRNRPWRT